MAFHASHHGGGLLESGFGGSGIDGAAKFGLVHQNGDFISIHFGETTHQSDGVPCTVGTHPQHTDVDGGEQGDVAGQDAELTGGTGQDHLVGAAIKDVLVCCQHAEGEGHEPWFEKRTDCRETRDRGCESHPRRDHLVSAAIFSALAFTSSMLPTR